MPDQLGEQDNKAMSKNFFNSLKVKSSNSAVHFSHFIIHNVFVFTPGMSMSIPTDTIFNLIKWVSPRLIKETFVPASDYRYPFLD